MMTERQADLADGILYEAGNFYVRAAEFGTGRFKPKSKGYEVVKNGNTHGTVAAIIGIAGEQGLTAAKAKADELAEKQDATEGRR